MRSQSVPERHDTGAARCRQSARRDDGIGASVSIRGAFTTHRARCVVSMPVRRRHDKTACHKRPPSGRLNPTCWTHPRAARVPTLECQRYALVTLMAGGNDRSHSVRFPDRPRTGSRSAIRPRDDGTSRSETVGFPDGRGDCSDRRRRSASRSLQRAVREDGPDTYRRARRARTVLRYDAPGGAASSAPQPQGGIGSQSRRSRPGGRSRRDPSPLRGDTPAGS